MRQLVGFAGSATSNGSSGHRNTSAPSVTCSCGLVPRPDPKNGLAILAIMGIAGQNASPGLMTNLLNEQTNAQVYVQERGHYMLP